MPRVSMMYALGQAGTTYDGSSPAPDKSATQERPCPQSADMLPVHPISWMQSAFEESIMDSVYLSPKLLRDKLSAEARRRQLLELEDDLFQGYSSRWRQRPSAKFHPLLKLIAQISFGVHLLHKDQAKSEHEVITILQGHVDEVDGFVEDTTADFQLATQDLEQRIHSLELPLRHGRTFNKMLCDGNFRRAILDGNQIIERVIDRTSKGMKSSLNDIAQGIGATQELAKYLTRLTPFRKHRVDLIAIYETMRGNAEGWIRCFMDLQAKGAKLASLMAELDVLVNEIAKRAGIASRRKGATGASTSGGLHTRTVSQSSTRSAARSAARLSTMNKPLPPDPMHKALADSTSPTSPLRHSPASTEQQPEEMDRKHHRPRLTINTHLGITAAGNSPGPAVWQPQTARSPSLYSESQSHPANFVGTAGLGIVTEATHESATQSQPVSALSAGGTGTLNSPVISTFSRSPRLPTIGQVEDEDTAFNGAVPSRSRGVQPRLVSEKEACSRAMMAAIHPGLVDEHMSWVSDQNSQPPPPSYNEVVKQIKSGVLTHQGREEKSHGYRPHVLAQDQAHPSQTNMMMNDAAARNLVREPVLLSPEEEPRPLSILPSPAFSPKGRLSPDHDSAYSSGDISEMSPSDTDDMTADAMPAPLNVKRSIQKTDAGWKLYPALSLPTLPPPQDQPTLRKNRNMQSIKVFFARKPSPTESRFVPEGLGGNIVPPANP